MTLKSLTLHRAAHDNAGNFLDASSDVTVGDGDSEIAADRAREIVSSHGAQGHHAQPDDKAPKGTEKAGEKGE